MVAIKGGKQGISTAATKVLHYLWTVSFQWSNDENFVSWPRKQHKINFALVYLHIQHRILGCFCEKGWGTERRMGNVSTPPPTDYRTERVINQFNCESSCILSIDRKLATFSQWDFDFPSVKSVPQNKVDELWSVFSKNALSSGGPYLVSSFLPILVCL